MMKMNVMMIAREETRIKNMLSKTVLAVSNMAVPIHAITKDSETTYWQEFLTATAANLEERKIGVKEPFGC